MPYKDPEKAKAAARARYRKNPEKQLIRQRQYREENRERIRAKDRARKMKNREERLVQQREYYKETREQQRARAKKYREENSEIVKERARLCSRKYRKENPEKAAAAEKRWRGKNVGKVRAKIAFRRKGIKERTPPWVDHDAIIRIYKEAKEWEETFGGEYHVDHIIPLHGKNVSGLHVPENLQILEAEAHRKKGNRFDG